MQNTSGFTRQDHFASHDCDILQALRLASPKPLASFRDIFDFGVGRLARMFKAPAANTPASTWTPATWHGCPKPSIT
jgi:hypothetical protein